MVTRTLKTVA